MSELTPEEEKKILDSPATGTFALMMVMFVVFVIGWAAMFFGMFLEHGPVK